TDDVAENQGGGEMIVVGVDGSTSSRDALRWAIDEARIRKTDVEALYAWRMPFLTGFEYIPPDLLDPDEIALRAKQVVTAAVEEMDGDGIRIESRAVEGAAAESLVEASRDADMLVLGSRGHGGFSGLLLGSVGQQCVHHAACPVVIVRPEAGSERRP